MATFTAQDDSAIFDNLIKYAIAPRPICFASTIDREGQVNLSPFSYFNLMSHNPAICVFSPLRRMRDGSTKHTLENIQEVPEVVINLVNYAIVQQQSLASTEYAKGINEFEKSGLTPIASTLVKPPRVAESPVQLECKVNQVIPLSNLPGAGNLVLAEILCMHVQDEYLSSTNTIEQHKLDLVARLGGDWYCRVTQENLFEVPKPLRNLGIGVDQLPESIRKSSILTGNQLAMLANVERIPAVEEILPNVNCCKESDVDKIHQVAAAYLNEGKVFEAWRVLLRTV
ncbi:flavin reductase family protein [Sphingobacterium hungaricum]|uniref:Flavin reductase n=1 Tax=Sphingobacterium hungaricum TaxID=2082723 RepID=A0A928V1G5_9SPHI|nr:flavin reductase family protein [Sphingobacterium hungaricum]MBE8715236.1 flavin reductase [Sphingobacterium hungaricum]